jgi:hypothetical protein
MGLYHADLIIYDLQVGPLSLNPRWDRLEHSLDMAWVVAYGDTSDFGCPMEIVQINLCRRHIKFFP